MSFPSHSASKHLSATSGDTAGPQRSRGDAVVILDGDLQDTPEELARFLVKWREG